MDASAAVPRHRTALNRVELSRPFRIALTDGVLGQNSTVMDYGCGRGDDVRQLEASGFDCTGWDPAHAPGGVRREADIVNLGYVVNVIENAAERSEVLRRAWGLTRRVLIVSARLTAETPQSALSAPYADGLLTRMGTFQKFFEQQELRSWIDQVLKMPSVAAGPGVFYIFRESVERMAFIAQRFRRVAAVPRVRVRDRLYAEHRVLLDGLASFVSSRGRLPAREELPGYDELERSLGSLKRAFVILQHASDTAAWERVRDARSQDLLAFLALSRFEGRPKFTDLPVELQLDIRAFFGSYAAGCRAADELLFSLGKLESLEDACRGANVGKLMPTALYVHSEALAELPLLLRLYEGCARSYVGTITGANIIKLGRVEPKVSYLSYPDFECDPHPPLHASVSVHLQTFRVRERSFANHKNPPVLHRKEELVGSAHPTKAKFARLTRLEEAKGLFADPARIGTRDGWERALDEQGLAMRGHRLVRAQPSDPKSASVERNDWSSTQAFYEERAAEYAKATLPLSMSQWLRPFTARLPVRAAVVDLGCGGGRDLAQLQERGFWAVGLDRSEPLAVLARRHSGAPVVVGDLRTLPFAEGAFGGAWASASLLHLMRKEICVALAEIRRVLCPEGVLFVSMKRGSGQARQRDGRWFTYVEPNELGNALENAGFQVLELHVDGENALLAGGGDGCWISCIAVKS